MSKSNPEAAITKNQDEELPFVSETSQRQAPENGSNEKEREASYPNSLIKLIHKYSPSYLLVNKGATARDHLANERTFLAYLRTSLSLLTVGIAIPQIARLPTDSNSSNQQALFISGLIIGSLFILLGLIFIIGGCVRYFYGQVLMVRGLFPSSRGMVVIGSFSLALIVVAVFVVTLVFS